MGTMKTPLGKKARPAVSIPSSEAWVYNNPKAISKVRKGLREASVGKVEKVLKIT